MRGNHNVRFTAKYDSDILPWIHCQSNLHVSVSCAIQMVEGLFGDKDLQTVRKELMQEAIKRNLSGSTQSTAPQPRVDAAKESSSLDNGGPSAPKSISKPKVRKIHNTTENNGQTTQSPSESRAVNNAAIKALFKNHKGL